MKRMLIGCTVSLLALALRSAVALAPLATELRVAVFGGSFSVIPPSEVIKDDWRARLGYTVDSFGVNGAGFAFASHGAGGTNSIPEQVERVVTSGRTYDLYVLWASTNDAWGRTVAEQNEGIEKCVRLIRQSNPAGQIAFLSSPPIPLKEKIEPNLGRLVDGQRKTCDRLRVPCLNLYEQAGFTAENARLYFGGDNLHMTEAGYAHIRKPVTEFIGECLNRAMPAEYVDPFVGTAGTGAAMGSDPMDGKCR